MIGKLIGIIIGAVLLVNVAIAMLPVTFNNTEITSFTVWGIDYLWIIGLVAMLLVFAMLLLFWNDVKRHIGAK